MRNKNSNFKFSMHAIFIFILTLVLISISYLSASAETQNLYIGCLEQVEEGEEFSIIVYAYSEIPDIDTYPENNVDIQFNGSDYTITEEILFLTAPYVEEDTTFLINASKAGFVSDTKTITIQNLDETPSDSNDFNLDIVPNSYLVKPGESFYVTVYYNNMPAEGVTVFIQNSGENEITNEYGVAYLTAPKDEETIIVKARKEGYDVASLELNIDQEKPIWKELIEHKFFPLFAAFIILLIAVIFVHFRQRRSIYARAKQISDKKVVEKYTSSEEIFSNAKKYGYENPNSSGEMVHVRPSSDSKVEEIRITRPQKQKEVVDVKPKKEEINRDTSQSNDKNADSEWFKGTDDIKYEIDKLTGEVDEEGMDKWFEGVEGLKDKVNEKMKKKKKERDDNK